MMLFTFFALVVVIAFLCFSQNNWSISNIKNKFIGNEERRRNKDYFYDYSHGYYDSIVPLSYFHSDVSDAVQENKETRKRVRALWFKGYNIYGTIVSNSGLSTWDFEILFDDHGHLTGEYQIHQEEDSPIPHYIARQVKTKVERRVERYLAWRRATENNSRREEETKPKEETNTNVHSHNQQAPYYYGASDYSEKSVRWAESYSWYCDNCGDFLDTQRGFNVKTGEWKCLKCGFINDVSTNNIIDFVHVISAKRVDETLYDYYAFPVTECPTKEDAFNEFKVTTIYNKAAMDEQVIYKMNDKKYEELVYGGVVRERDFKDYIEKK